MQGHSTPAAVLTLGGAFVAAAAVGLAITMVFGASTPGNAAPAPRAAVAARPAPKPAPAIAEHSSPLRGAPPRVRRAAVHPRPRHRRVVHHAAPKRAVIARPAVVVSAPAPAPAPRRIVAAVPPPRPHVVRVVRPQAKPAAVIVDDSG